jgi:hypothetical protein
MLCIMALRLASKASQAYAAESRLLAAAAVKAEDEWAISPRASFPLQQRPDSATPGGAPRTAGSVVSRAGSVIGRSRDLLTSPLLGSFTCQRQQQPMPALVGGGDAGAAAESAGPDASSLARLHSRTISATLINALECSALCQVCVSGLGAAGVGGGLAGRCR